MTHSQVLITGGAGFIGINAAEHFLKHGSNVTIVDNFSRKGSRENALWLRSVYPNVEVLEADVRENSTELHSAVSRADLILHLAAQVAVTTSVQNPREDFAINAGGTLNMLELARASHRDPIFMYSSTNKVYGSLEDVKLREKKLRYDFSVLKQGVDEHQPLDFHSPYGCSKGTADQYVHDYARIYGLRTVVFRQSCIYGPHQFGIEDQGWLAWFMICVLRGKPVTIYGNGKQVRDVLYVEDLISAYDKAASQINVTSGQVYNIGGGAKNSLSVWYEYGPLLEELFQKKIHVIFESERPGDQKIFIADTQKAARDFGWNPKTSKREGITRLYDWIRTHKELFL
jgi:CDP-paratose 2-epimerase